MCRFAFTSVQNAKMSLAKTETELERVTEDTVRSFLLNTAVSVL
jgi:hypothetical protein